MCVSVCLNVEWFSTVLLGYEDKAIEGNCSVLLMNDDEYTWVICVCVFVGVRVKHLRLMLLQMSLFAISIALVGVNFWAAYSRKILLIWVFTLCITACCRHFHVSVCVSNLLQWAVTNSHVHSGTPLLWCECNEGFRCRNSPASRPSPSPRNYNRHTHSL